MVELGGGMMMRGETSITSIDIRSGLSSGIAGSAVREDPADGVDELERPERLGEVLRGAHGEPGLLVALALVRGEHHDRYVLCSRLGLELTADLEAIRPWPHVDVEEDEVRLLGPSELERLGAVLGLEDRPALR